MTNSYERGVVVDIGCICIKQKKKKTTAVVYHKPRTISKAYGIGGYKAALASCKFRGVFDTDSASLSIVERISEEVFGQRQGSSYYGENGN